MSTAGRFTSSRNGNIAIMFGLFLVPMLAGAGVAIDMLRSNMVRAQLAEAADSGLLAAARAKSLDPSLTNADAEKIARKYFDANYRQSADIIVDLFDFSGDGGDGKFSLQVKGEVKTAILGVVGNDSTPIDINSAARIAPPRALEVALVLDNTLSMQGAKLTALKNAAEDLVDKVMADKNNEVKIGLIPFSNYVNVGLSRRNESWLDVDDDSSSTSNVCRNTYPDRTVSNCRKRSATCMRDGVPYSCEKQDCDVDNGDPVRVCKDESHKFTWRGCVGSRDYPRNIKDGGFTGANRVPGLLNYYCPQELLPLTTDKSTVISDIKAMSVQGNTYIPSGLTWGLRLMSNEAPFTEGETYQNIKSDDGLKAMVLMTDGANTKSANYPDHGANNVVDANDITEELCDEIKSNEISLYTIAFEVSDKVIKKLLEGCATSTENYYDADDAEALADAFDAIANSLTELALTK